MTRLMERWFPSPEQQAAEAREEMEVAAHQIERAHEFLQVGYMRDFLAWLAETRRRVEPGINQPNEMVYHTGLRDGVQLVMDHLEDLQERVKRGINA